QLRISREGLEPGVYHDKLVIDGGSAGSKEIPIQMQVAAVQQEIPIQPGDEWRYFKGQKEPPKAWNQLDFDDSDWLAGPSGIGYSNDIQYATTLNDMPHNYISFYARRTFQIVDPSSYANLTLGMVYDDGFVAYINGVEVVRSPSMGSPAVPSTFKTKAAKAHDEGLPETLFAIPLEGDLLKSGDNVLAIQVHNDYIGSGDCGMVPRLLAGRMVEKPANP
ncbi:MAG: hypothetical protein GXY44_06820, partial [Phycisphaerales bacterium]|nr:hypothetical protein [Phycisphaerales bacterium]